jgi:hypothetical protein
MVATPRHVAVVDIGEVWRFARVLFVSLQVQI